MIYSSNGIKSSLSVIRPTFLPPRTQRLPKGLPEESAYRFSFVSTLMSYKALNFSYNMHIE